MKLALMQPYLFPYLGYFQLLSSVDVFVFYDDAAYIKQGFINRNVIALQGRRHAFTWPVSDQSSYRQINQHYVARSGHKLMLTMEQAYRHCPHWPAAERVLGDVFCCASETNISRLAENSIELSARYAGVAPRFLRASEIQYERSGSPSQKILSICGVLGASTYVNSAGGRALYNEAEFVAQGVQLRFHQPTLSEYPQFRQTTFEPALSIIDLMANLPAHDVGAQMQAGALMLADEV